MQVKYYPFSLKFRHPFTISKGTKTHQPTLVVELEHFGIKGYGEAPAIAYYNIPVEKMIEDLEAKKPFIEKFALPLLVGNYNKAKQATSFRTSIEIANLILDRELSQD